MNNNQNLLTVEMAADYLHCHPETVRRMIRRGELKAVKFRKFWRVPMEGLRRVENAALDAPASTPAKGAGQSAGIGTFLTKAEALRDRLRQSGYTGASGAEVVNAARDERTARIIGDERE